MYTYIYIYIYTHEKYISHTVLFLKKLQFVRCHKFKPKCAIYFILSFNVTN